MAYLNRGIRLTPFKARRRQTRSSEDSLALRAGLSRSGLRSVESPTGNPSLGSVARVAAALGHRACVLSLADDADSECSTVAVGLKVLRDGEDSWKIHFLELVDEFRRSLDASLLLLAPPRGLSARLVALLASMVTALAEEVQMDVPPWASERRWLPSPWFVSGMESLKATALLESPLAFRSNNVFVLANFMSRV